MLLVSLSVVKINNDDYFSRYFSCAELLDSEFSVLLVFFFFHVIFVANVIQFMRGDYIRGYRTLLQSVSVTI